MMYIFRRIFGSLHRSERVSCFRYLCLGFVCAQIEWTRHDIGLDG